MPDLGSPRAGLHLQGALVGSHRGGCTPRAAHALWRPSQTKPQQLAYPTAPLRAPLMVGSMPLGYARFWLRRGAELAARSGLMASAAVGVAS